MYGLMSDAFIMELCKGDDRPMIKPFIHHQVNKDDAGNRVISYGLSSCGYDIRLGSVFKKYVKANDQDFNPIPVDPLNIRSQDFATFDTKGEPFILDAHSFVLAHSMEYFHLPPTVTAMLFDKSSMARCGLNLQETIMEPGWYGEITLELFNNLDRPLKLYPGQGIGQLLFFKHAIPLTSYADRSGKYQGQTGVQIPIT